MANERRILRLQQLILEVAAETLQREARDPLLELVSITRVKLTSDLSSAQVYWSCLGQEPQRLDASRSMRQGVQNRISSPARQLHVAASSCRSVNTNRRSRLYLTT